MPSKHALDISKEWARAELHLADRRDVEAQKRGLIAPMTDLKIIADAGHVAWDLEHSEFLAPKGAFPFKCQRR